MSSHTLVSLLSHFSPSQISVRFSSASSQPSMHTQTPMSVLTHTFTQTPAATFIMLLQPIHHIPLSPHSSLRHRHGVSKHLMEFRAVVGFLMFYSESLAVHNSPQRGGTHGEWKENACVRNKNDVCSSAKSLTDCLLCFHTLWPWVMTFICPWQTEISLIVFDLMRVTAPSVALCLLCHWKDSRAISKSFWHHNLKKVRRDTIHICQKN